MYGKERQYVLCGKLAQDASRRVNVCHQVNRPFCTVTYRAVLYCFIMHLLYWSTVCCTVLHSAALHCTVLSLAVLHVTYYPIPYFTVSCRNNPTIPHPLNLIPSLHIPTGEPPVEEGSRPSQGREGGAGEGFCSC
jgi:hypothetical protein